MTRSYLFIERHFWHPCSKFIGKRARFGWTRWDYVAGVTSKDDCVTTSYNDAVTHNNMDESHRQKKPDTKKTISYYSIHRNSSVDLHINKLLCGGFQSSGYHGGCY